MIEVSNVTKIYGKLKANDDISLNINAGTLAVLLGPNGAGKSTLIKSICGLLRFEGKITIFEQDNHSIEAKRLMGYIPEMPAIFNMLTVYEHLEFIAKAYQLSDWQPYADELLARFEMDDKKKKLGKELSKGMQQKVSICCALLPRPKAVIFDEPFVGLDPHAIRELKKVIQELKDEGCAVMFSTHMIESMEDNWDTTYIMKNGKLIESKKRSEVVNNASLEMLYFEITEGAGERESKGEGAGEVDKNE